MEPNTQPIRHSSLKTVVFLCAVFVLLLVVTYVVRVSLQKTAAPASSPTVTTKENVTTQKVDLSSTSGASRLPSGFPADFPVEAATITESYTVDYKDHGVVQSSVSYTSSKSVNDLYKTYTDYLVKAGYALKGGQNNPSGKSLSGFLEKNEVSVVISAQNNKTLVQISYLSRS